MEEIMRSVLSGIKLILIVLVGRRFVLSYIDPNTGGMLFQALVVIFGLLTGVIYFFSARIKMLFARLRRSPKEEGADGDNLELANLLEDAPVNETSDDRS